MALAHLDQPETTCGTNPGQLVDIGADCTCSLAQRDATEIDVCRLLSGYGHDDERIWSMVAFLQRLPDLSTEQYQIITAREQSEK